MNSDEKEVKEVFNVKMTEIGSIFSLPYDQ